MRISFDIDDTLICHPSIPCEPTRVPRLLRSWLNESLRLGTVGLMQELARQGHDLWIYTTSHRDPLYLHCLFALYGVKIRRVINQRLQDKNPEILSRFAAPGTYRRRPSKYPPAYGIDLHIDDSEGVWMEGREHGCRVVVVSPDDLAWAEKILASVRMTSSRFNRNLTKA